jgi:HD superfamily phosphohydrolase
MHLADRMLLTIYEADKSESGDGLLKWDEDKFRRNRKLLRVLCLLHDVGHGLFSHTGEGVLFPDGLDHEKYTGKIIAENGEIKDIVERIFEEDGMKSSEELSLFWREGLLPEFGDPLLKQIVNGPLDADKMDYLWRDSHYCGVPTGKFDMDRLLHTMRVVKDIMSDEQAIGIHGSGIPAAEQMIIARYYMYLQVYFNKTRRAYDKHLTDFLRDHFLEDGKYPLDVNQYLLLGDDDVVRQLHAVACDKSKPGSKSARRLVCREHFQMLEESREDASPKDKDIYEKACHKLKEEFGDGFFTDSSNDAPNKFKYERFWVRSRNSTIDRAHYQEIEKSSVMIKKFDTPLLICRIYHSPELKNRKNEVFDFMRKKGFNLNTRGN